MKFFKTICALLILLLPLLVFQKAFGQNATVTLTPQTVSFNVQTLNDVTVGSTIPNAFQIDIQNKNSSYDLTATVTEKTFNPSGAVFSGIPFTISLASYAGPTTSNSSLPQALQENPGITTIATSATGTKGKETASWIFNLTLLPIGFSIPPGSYLFTVKISYADSKSSADLYFNINLTVSSIVDMSLTQNSSPTVNFGNSAAYVNGVSINTFHSMQIKSNLLWQVSVAANSPYFSSGSAGASANMPCSIMKIKANDASTYLPLSTTATTIKTGGRGDASALGNSPTFDVNFNPGYDYNPGVYNLSLTYTLTSQ